VSGFGAIAAPLPAGEPRLARPSAPTLDAAIAAMGSEADHRAAIAFFTDYRRRSLMFPPDLALLYRLVLWRRAKSVLEIGSYFGGTTEMLARALLAAGGGSLAAVDPWGEPMFGRTLAEWPEPLRRQVTFFPLTSMDFFISCRAAEPRFDLVLIDGNHDYEFVLHDLTMTARHAAAGAVVVLDDCDQAGVFHAARDFLAVHPGWHEAGGAMARWDRARPLASMGPSLAGTKMLVLEAPSAPTLGERPLSLALAVEGTGLKGIELELVPDHGGGAIEALAVLRAFPHDADRLRPEQRQALVRAEIGRGQALAWLGLAPPLALAMREADTARRELEILLSWSGEPVRLAAPPMPHWSK